ncbi:MAG: SNF2-like helicase [Hyperionvirus sp.]|uniref:SNF2-like helicase n=1 Tax=Hyperionvirus sp. TaxID=2487770 RepID=A0A3G5AA28_9VIRU|nr:MAG: SNF2-like helicase [Hyperionvirus sp.]
MKYPSIDDSDFYEKISKIYKRFTIPKAKKTFDEICFPKKFQLQLPQEFLAEYLNPNTPYKGVLVYHRIGAGKTCTAVRIAETWKKDRNILVVVPASLKGNFRGELRTQCADNSYLKPSERKRLAQLPPTDSEYLKIINKSDQRIDKIYSIYSYNKFVELAKDDEISLTNTLLIIDEIQNMVSEEGTYYQTLYDLIQDAPKDLRIVLLSATPMFDKPNEIALTMNLLRLPVELPTGREFYKMFVRVIKKRNGTYIYKTKNMDYFKSCIKGYVSYFRGAPPYVFPTLRIRYVKCEMSEFQYSAYKEVSKQEEKEYNRNHLKRNIKDIGAIKALTIKNLPNNFFIGARIVSNIVFPNRKLDEAGFASFKGKYITENLEKYSIKFHKMMTRISGSGGKIIIYSSFKGYGGITSFRRVLETFGYKNYADDGPGVKRYALWTGDEDVETKNEVREVYNNPNNLGGRQLKILILSASGKEGLSTTAVTQMHILEPYWNQSRIDQVIGRASRFCSHKDVAEEKRIVRVYVYLAVHPDEPETVDQYMFNLSTQKNKLIDEFEKAIKEVAFDCELFKNANTFEDEDKIECDK